MKLNELFDENCPTKSRKRVGRGIGSGLGKNCGKGHKGQKSRSGVAINGFEGGQMPIHRRLPKRGFNNIFRVSYETVNTSSIQGAVSSGKLDPKKKITVAELKEAGLLRPSATLVKLLGKGELKESINIELQAASSSAIEKVKKAGGKVSVLLVNNKDQAA